VTKSRCLKSPINCATAQKSETDPINGVKSTDYTIRDKMCHQHVEFFSCL
jgi:hypothetical protein